MEILRCEKIRKVYGSGNGQVIALDNVNLSVQKGEFVAIVGASGSGKSTLLHILGSVDKPTEGKVFVEETDVSKMNRTQAAIFRRRKVGLVYQFYNLIPTLTVRNNILMPLMLDKRKPNKEFIDQIVGWKEERNRMIHALLGQVLTTEELVSLAEEGKKLARELSNKAGNYKRAVERRDKKKC